MKRIFKGFLAIIALAATTANLQAQQECLSLNMTEMESQRAAMEAGDSKAKEKLRDIKAKGDRALKGKSFTIVDKKAKTPSGDKHDYISMGPYWWPDPSKADGLPYINRDGQINPERDAYTDHKMTTSMASAVSDLGLAYYFTQDDKYAKRAQELVKVFFLDEATKMNPNLNYGQFVPGLCEGRGIGIIETACFGRVLQGVILASQSKVWSESVSEGLKSWFREYLTWLSTHEYGIAERNAANNHGTHYDVQCVEMYMYVGDIEAARNHIKSYTMPRLESQVAADGSQPHELKRTKSWSYSNMNLGGFIELAELSERLGIDLWNYSKDGQVYIRSMIDWYIPYIKMEKKWDTKQIAKADVRLIIPKFEVAAEKYGDDSYLEVIKSVKPLSDNIILK